MCMCVYMSACVCFRFHSCFASTFHSVSINDATLEEKKKLPTNKYACVTVPVSKFHAKHSEVSISLLFTAVLCRRSCTCSKAWI